MAKKKVTAWLRFGRSGDTIDGRVIKDTDIQQAAESYDPNFYTALIWPDHNRWYNFGKVVAVRAEKNDEGGWDLFGQIEANDIYKSINAAGQKIFTSMELFPDFRKSGKTYLSGLGATDNPASVATSEVHLTQVEEPGVLVAQYYEAVSHNFDDSQDDSDEKSLIAGLVKFFKSQSDSDEDTMSKPAIKALQIELEALGKQFKSAFPGDDKTPVTPPNTSGLSEQVTALSQQVKELQEKLDKAPETPVKDDKYTELKTALDSLTTKFTAALEEKPGTDGGEHDSDGKDLSACI